MANSIEKDKKIKAKRIMANSIEKDEDNGKLASKFEFKFSLEIAFQRLNLINAKLFICPNSALFVWNI